MYQTGNILIIDQDPTVADLIVEILTDAGYVAYAAQNGADALAALACDQPGLIMLDVGWHGTCNGELIAHVRAMGLTSIPLVVMSTAPRCAAALLGSAAVECLAKPFDLDDLLACVARYVQPFAALPSLHTIPYNAPWSVGLLEMLLAKERSDVRARTGSYSGC